MSLPKGEVQGFFVSKKHDGPQLFVSILHSTDAPFSEYNFYVILEPQEMASIDSIGEYYGSFDVSPEHQNRIVHVYKQLYKHESPKEHSNLPGYRPVRNDQGSISGYIRD